MLRFFFSIASLLIAGPAFTADPPKVSDLVQRLETGAPGERVIAAEQLGDLGPVAVDAIPALTRTARTARRLSIEDNAETSRANKYLYQAVVGALIGIGPKSAPALVELLPGEKEGNFGAVNWSIGAFDWGPTPVSPALAKLLADDDQDFRVCVAGVLERIGPGAESAVPALVALFENPKNKDVNGWASGPLPPPPRVAAVRALVRIGPKAAPALADKVLPTLAKELKTGESAPGGQTADILNVLGEAGAPLVPAVVTAFRNGEHRLDRQGIAQSLLVLGAGGRKAFAELLAGEAPEVRRELVDALKWYLWHEHSPRYYHFDAPSLDVAPFIPALVTALKDPEPEQRLAAAELLSDHPNKVPASARDAVFALFRDPAVEKLLKENDGFLFHSPRLGRFGEPGFRALIALLGSDSAAVRKFALDQLPVSRKELADALPKLRRLADDPNPELALNAAYRVAWLSLDPKDAAPLAGRRFLRRADPEIRAGAANRLEWLGPVGVPHLDSLVPLLDDKDDQIIQAAAGAIHAGAPKGSVAARALAERKLVRNGALRFVVEPEPKPERRPPDVPELIGSVSSGDDWQRVRAALDLGDRGAAAKEAVPTLKKLVLDPDPDLRFAASCTLARIAGDAPALRQLLTRELERLANGRRGAWIAGTVFERLPPDFPDLIPVVVRCLERHRDATALIAGLEKYGPKAKAAVPALRKVLRGPEPPVHIHAWLVFNPKPACTALGAIGPDARDALPELQQLFDSGDVQLALTARDSIRKITGGE